MSTSKKIMVVVPKLSQYEKRNLYSIGIETFVKLAALDPVYWKPRLGVRTFTNKTLKKPKTYAILLNIYHYKSKIDVGTGVLAGLIYLRWNPNAIMPPML